MSNLEKKLEELKNNFYKDNKKNTFFKNKQKIECSKSINNSISFDLLVESTFQTNKTTNKIIFHYPIFKTYANYDNANRIIEYFFHIVKEKLDHFQTYELHINMDSYTITSHERFKDMYYKLFEKNNKENLLFNQNLLVLNVYNSPSILVTLNPFFSAFVKSDISDKVILFSKKETGDKLKKLIP